MKFGIFYELQLPRPWADGDEHRLYQNALEQIELADRLGYDYAWEVEHHFLEEYSHSPVARSPSSPPPASAPSRSGSATASCSSPPTIPPASPSRSPRSTCCRTAAASSAWARAPRSPSSSRSASRWRTSARSSRRPSAPSCRCSRTAPSEHHGKYFNMPLRNGRAQAAAEAASAAVGRLLAARDAGQVRRMGHGRARLPVRLGRRRARLGARLLQRLREAAEEARRLRHQPEHRAGLVLHVRARPTRRRASAPTATPSSSSRCASTRAAPGRRRPPAGTVNMWDEYQKWKTGQSGGARRGAARRPDRLAGDDPAQAAQLPVVQHRPGRAAQPGRPQHARAHLRIARAVRQGSDARVPGGASRAAASGSSRC